MIKTRGNRGWAALVAILTMLAAVIAAPAQQNFKTVLNFDGTDGAAPLAGLVQGFDGNLYGTTYAGGSGSGTFFRVRPSGALTVLYNFCAQSGCLDGEEPEAVPVQAADGNFYGTTAAGGANGDGTVFEITPTGALTTLYSFCARLDCTGGAFPDSGLVQGRDGSFWGTTSAGGSHSDGTVFKITPTGTLTTVYSFCSESGCADGYSPEAPLVQASNGEFYGTTTFGGANSYGSVFTITPSGKLTTLASFNMTEGAYPEAGLIQATDGNFYGTTFNGGSADTGVVFRMTPGGALKALYSFCTQSGCPDGANPAATLMEATDGSFFGVTPYGGADGNGTVFSISPTGRLTTLYSFDSTDGANPFGSLVEDTGGSVYGTATNGGINGCEMGCGTIFELQLGLRPFVKPQPSSGEVGSPITILGTNLTGATRVKFNNTAATFTIVSASELSTAVPAGATTGPVQVVTPTGTLTSNVNFRVLP